ERRFTTSPTKHGGSEKCSEHGHSQQQDDEAAPAESTVGCLDRQILGEQWADDHHEHDVDASNKLTGYVVISRARRWTNGKPKRVASDHSRAPRFFATSGP